jgi:putative transposase
LDYLPRKAQDDCLTELKWLYDRRDLAEAHRDLQGWLTRWEAKYGKLCQWVEENIEETFTFYRLPREHHKHLKSTNMLERLNEEIKRRTHVVRIFPNEAACLRLVRALAQEIHEDWIEDNRYLNMDLLKEHKKAQARVSAAA